MKLTKVMLCLGTLALSVANAASSKSVNLTSSVWVGDTQLKPGQYKVELVGDKAMFKSGKNVVEVPAKLETVDRKFADTSVETTDSKVKEVRLGGTNTKIVLKSGSVSAAGN